MLANLVGDANAALAKGTCKPADHIRPGVERTGADDVGPAIAEPVHHVRQALMCRRTVQDPFVAREAITRAFPVVRGHPGRWHVGHHLVSRQAYLPK